MQTTGIIDGAVYFVQTGDTGSLSPEISDTFQGIITVDKMFQGDTSSVPDFYPKGGLVGRLGLCLLAQQDHHNYGAEARNKNLSHTLIFSG